MGANDLEISVEYMCLCSTARTCRRPEPQSYSCGAGCGATLIDA